MAFVFHRRTVFRKARNNDPMSFHVHVDPLSYIASGPWRVSKAVGVGVLLQCSDWWVCVCTREGQHGKIIRFVGRFDDRSMVTTTSCINITVQGDSVGYVKSFKATKFRFKNQLSMQASRQVNQQNSKASEMSKNTRSKGKKARCMRLQQTRKSQLEFTNYNYNEELITCSPRRTVTRSPRRFNELQHVI